MTTAVIYLDPLAIHPVINGEWHRTRLTEIPQPGGTITMLCGISATAAFQPLNQRRRRQIPANATAARVVTSPRAPPASG